jgi:hypothetical protein
MTAGNGKANAEAQVRALIDYQAKAIRAKDVDGSVAATRRMSCCSTS